MARHSTSSLPDLLAWPEIKAAQEEVKMCNDARNKAIRASFVARYGTKTIKQKELLEANNRLLKAELELEKLMKKANLQ